MPFESPDKDLSELLDHVRLGKIQLPDFQREWKWEDDRIRELLVSVARGHPVGVLMMLQVGGTDVRFAPKTISGVDPHGLGPPENLVLDGQQRLTSLFQALTSNQPVQTTDPRGKRLERWYYVDIRAAVDDDADPDDAVFSVPADRIVREQFGKVIAKDFSSRENEYEAEVFPLSLAYDMSAIFEWAAAYAGTSPERVQRWSTFYTRMLGNVVSYKVPVIVLTKETSKEAVCTVFEKVNTGGVPLNVFELLTATYAAGNFRLKDDWDARKQRLNRKAVLRGIENTDFLQVITLLATRDERLAWTSAAGGTKAPGISCKRKDVLRLTLDAYRKWADPVTDAFEWAASFLGQEHIFRNEDIPYRSQLVPLVAIKVVLGAAGAAHGVAKPLQQWYWCGVLGELYGSTTETRFARDLEQVVEWLDGGPTPATIGDAVFQAPRLMTLRTRLSAAYKGIYALLMRGDCRDWAKAEPIGMAAFFNYQVDIHHIFPKAWCEKNAIDPTRRESIVNKTPLAADTNRAVGGRSPAEYVLTLEEKSGLSGADLDAIIASHLIDAASLRSADFDGFFADRRRALLDLIADAMRKPVVSDGEADLGDATAFEDEASEPEPAEETVAI